MIERPILFSTPMVRRLLADQKCMTRRIMRRAFDGEGWAWGVFPARESGWIAWFGMYMKNGAEFTKAAYKEGFPCRYGQPGDRLWVREAWAMEENKIFYRADHEGKQIRWKPSFFLPRTLSRITLEITDVRAERLNHITYADVIAEGLPQTDEAHITDARQAFAVVWDTINAKKAPWSANPWVWAISFKRVA